MMAGGNVELAKCVANSVSIPVIYVGGISSPEDAALIAKTEVSALGIASIFHFTDFTPNDCRERLKLENIPVR